mgnify:CR=1 FL=1
MNCILCPNPAKYPCPRCLQPLCQTHGERRYADGLLVYDPAENCRAPLAARFRGEGFVPETKP